MPHLSKRIWILALLLAPGFLPAQEAGPNPYTSGEDLAAGARLFRIRCALCHGGDARGGRGPDLTRGLFRYGSSDAALYRTIRSGVPQSGMPRLGQSGQRVWQLVTFVRSLSRSPVESEVPGSAASGERLFRGKGNCGGCHMVDGRGGRLGPELSEIGWLRSTRHLRLSIVDPDQQVDRRYWALEVVHRDGRKIRGILLNEDSYSIQVMDMSEKLLSFPKSDLKEMRHEARSWMPNYQNRFSREELDDLVAFLYSRRGKEDRP